MTTTELIELLKKNERGGATGRPREVMFKVNDRIIDTDSIEVIGSGDGLISELYLSLPSAQPEPKTTHWVPLDERFASWSSYYKCSECGFRIKWENVTDFGGQSVDYCPHCGAKMEEQEMRLIDADSLKAKIMGEPPEARYPSWYAAMVDAEPDASIVGLKTIDAMIQAAYKAGKEGKPLMVALNEEVTT